LKPYNGDAPRKFPLIVVVDP